MKRRTGVQPDGPAPGHSLSANKAPSAAGGQSEVLSQTRSQNSSARWCFPNWLLAVVLAAGTFIAYQPVWSAGFIWDDDAYVTQNKLLTAPDGLKRIWFSQDSPSQYFPLVYTVFRLEHAIWRFSPVGYHLVNILLHACNALLLWCCLRRLTVPGAWLAAAFFALHPVQVESVAWVTELKNVLSLFFFLLAVLAWIGFIDDPPKRRWGFYGAMLACYILALFAKTTACTLPAALLLVLWLRHKKLTVSRWAAVAPVLLLGLAMGLLTVWWERHHIGTTETVVALGFRERLLIASRGVWFYLGKLLWPFHLAFSYPRWSLAPSNPLAYGWLVLCLVASGAILIFRKSVGRSVEVAAIFFVSMLAPMLGFIMLFTFRYTFVADHYQYVACIGPLTLLAAGIHRGLSPWRQQLPWIQPACAAALTLGLGALTWQQARPYRDVESLWRDTLTKNPDSWLAHSNLGNYLMRQGQFDLAANEYLAALRIEPRDVNAMISLGNVAFAQGRRDEAATFYQRALEVNPAEPQAHANLAVILADRGQFEEAIAHNRRALESNPLQLKARVNLAVTLARVGRYAEALEHYQKALDTEPDAPMTHLNLAIALEALGRAEEARLHYQKAAALINAHAAKLAQQGQLAEAAAQYEQAFRLIQNNPEAHYGLASVLLRQGKTTEARAQLLEALRLRADYPEAKQRLRELDADRAVPRSFK